VLEKGLERGEQIDHNESIMTMGSKIGVWENSVVVMVKLG
jgi:hypothetical protein